MSLLRRLLSLKGSAGLQTTPPAPPAYTEFFNSFTIGVANAWTDYNIFANKGIPKGAIVEIVYENAQGAEDCWGGIRTDGSALDKRIQIHEAEAGGVTCLRDFATVHATTGLIECYTSNTANVFRIVGYWVNISWTETWFNIFNTQVATWQDKDIFALGVPKGRVCHAILRNKDQANGRQIGIRTDGSSINRNLEERKIHEAEGASGVGENVLEWFVKSHPTTGIVETFSASIANAWVTISGYFGSAMDYVEKTVMKDITVAGWSDWDLTADLDQDGRVTDFVCSNGNGSDEYYCGGRIKGSALERRILVHESETPGLVEYTGFGLTIKSDANGVIQLYFGTNINDGFFLLGYFKY